MYLFGLVVELWVVVCDFVVARDDREVVAVGLVWLAEVVVLGVAFEHWWGFASFSDDGLVVDLDCLVFVSLSRIESFLCCELCSLLQDFGVCDCDQVLVLFGMFVYELVVIAPLGIGFVEFERLFDERWVFFDFGAFWFVCNERAWVGCIFVKLVDWLRDSCAVLELVGIEDGFDVEVGDAVICGCVDRFECDCDGWFVVVDFKIMKLKLMKDEFFWYL